MDISVAMIGLPNSLSALKLRLQILQSTLVGFFQGSSLLLLTVPPKGRSLHVCCSPFSRLLSASVMVSLLCLRLLCLSTIVDFQFTP